jgi:hypothetical protein
MTKLEILSEIEQLKDYVNDAGKAKLQALKLSVEALNEPVPAVVEAVVKEKEPDETTVKPRKKK